MSTSFYCIVQSAPWISRHTRYAEHLRGTVVDEFVHRSARVDILSRGADKLGIVVDRSKGIAHYFRPLVGDVIRAARFAAGYGADISVEIYRWTGDEATTTEFRPLAETFLSRSYPERGDGQGLGFGQDGELLVLKDAFPEDHAGPVYGPTTEELTGKQKRDGSRNQVFEERRSLQLDPRFGRFMRR